MLCLLQLQHRSGKVTWSFSSPCFIFTLQFHKFQRWWGQPVTAASGTIGKCNICTSITVSEWQKVKLLRCHLQYNSITGLIVQARKRKSKLGSEALEQEAEIQVSCKVSMRFAGILLCNKWQPMTGQCIWVQEDTAKSQSWTLHFSLLPLLVM